MYHPDLENNLLKTLLELSRLDDENEIRERFAAALNRKFPGADFTFTNPGSTWNRSSVDVRRGSSSFGRIYYSPAAVNDLDKEIITDAAGMLALVFENRSQAEAVSELKKTRYEAEHGPAPDERFNRMAGISPAVISEYTVKPDRTLVYRYISPAAIDVYGFNPDELIRDSRILRERIHPDDRKNIRITLLDSNPEISVARYAARYNHPVKGEVWLQSHSNISILPDGTMEACDFTTDITELKHIEEKLRESEERYRGIFENAAAGIYMASVDEKLLGVNPALARMHGFDSPDEMVSVMQPGLTLAVNPDDGRRFFDEIHTKGEISGFEMELYKKDHGTLWVSISARVVKDAGNSPLYFVGAVEDITGRKLVMNRLREKEAHFEKLTSCVPGMLYQFEMKPDGSLCVPYCSSQVKDIFGYEPPDIRDSFEPIMRTILPDDHEMIFRTIRESAAELTPWMAEFRVQPPGRPLKWIMGNSVPEKSEDGTITWYGFHTDITALKQAEEELRARDEQMRNIVENTEEIIHIIDREGIFRFLSPSWEKSTGFRLSETTGRSFLPYVHPDDAPACLEVLMNVFNTGEPHKISEFRVKHASGKWIWFSNSGVALKDAGGNTVNFLGVAADITDRKNAENLILAERDFSRAIIDSLPGLFYIINNEGRFIRWNRNLNAFSGYSDDELSKISIVELAPESFIPAARAAIEEVLADGHAEVEAFLIAADRTVKPFLTNGSLFYNDGKPYIIGLSQDISDRKRLEEQLLQSQKMEAVGQLAGGVAHDFNNLLQAILGYVELVLRKMPESDSNYNRMLEVKRAGDRATMLTRQLLAFSRRQVLQLSLLDINEVVAELIQMLTRLIGEDIELVFKPSRHPVTARADRGQIEQVITNLCVNARDAMPGGGRLVIATSSVFADEAYIHGHEWARPGPYICISVTDTGTGIDEETMNKIFEPFFTTKEKHRGTGLGLPMVYGIVRQHQGMVQVYSEPGNGSCFRVYLPAETGGTADEHFHHEPEEAAGGTETILMAEDDKQIRELTLSILKEAGYSVFTAADGQEAIDIYRSNAGKIDLLFMDVVMPRMSGRAVYDRVKELSPGIKCLFASGYSRDGLHNNYILEEGLHLLQKPYSRSSLLRLVRQVLDE